MRHIALASVVLVGLTATASAKRVYVPPAPTVTLVRSTSPALVEHLERNDAALVACAANERRAALSVRVSARWDATGRMRSVAVQGGSARFNRCASTALRGPIAVTRRGNGNALIKVPRPGKGTPAMPLTPTPAPKPVAMDSCQADTDCTLYFRTQRMLPPDTLSLISMSQSRPAFAAKLSTKRHRFAFNRSLILTQWHDHLPHRGFTYINGILNL